MSEMDLFISWLYNNDECYISDDNSVYALQLVNEGKSIDEVKKALRGY
jgi:hypothetical protein